MVGVNNMQLNYEDLQRLVEDSVERVMKRNGYAHQCDLEEMGIDKFTHQIHHRNIQQFMDDWVNIRKKAIAGMIITFAAALGGILMVGLTVMGGG